MVTTELQGRFTSDNHCNDREIAIGELVAVYHRTHNELLSSIILGGLSASRDKSKTAEAYREKRRIADGIIDRFAPRFCPGFSRNGAIYADLERAPIVEPFSWSTTDLEVMISPRKVIVVDQWFYDRVREALERRKLKEIVWNARQYWKTAVTLQEYRKRGGGLFAIPEVVIPEPVDTKRIRVLSN
ncbi:MAG: hypothetical protein M1372_01425 [Patescibacteria group bacterium]|nr:hypothetical protein [Patescibacteria group bacterium]